MTAVTKDEGKTAVSPLSAHLDIIQCPNCEGRLEAEPVIPGLCCTNCRHLFQSDGQIPLLFWPTEGNSETRDVTQVVRAFYEETPFPNYDDLDSPERLR